MLLKCFDGPMDGACYVLTKETEKEYLRSTNRKPDGVWFDGTDEHGRNVQHQYAFDKTIDQSIGAPINAYSVCLCYRYTGPVVDTGLTLETEEHVVGTREREPEISGNDIADEIEAERPDWRIGLSAKPKYRQHEMYYEPPSHIVAVHQSGFGGVFCKDGVLVLEGRFGVRFLAPAEEWKTA